MFGILASAVYGIYENRIKNKALITLCYFATLVLIWAADTFCIGGLTLGKNIYLGIVDPGILLHVPLAGFVLGLIFCPLPLDSGSAHVQ